MLAPAPAVLLQPPQKRTGPAEPLGASHCRRDGTPGGWSPARSRWQAEGCRHPLRTPRHTSDSRLDTRRQDPPVQGLVTPWATSGSLLSIPAARSKAGSPRLPQSLQPLSQRPVTRPQPAGTPGCSRGSGDPRERCPR